MAIKSANTILATIQHRRGAEEFFDPNQMTAGEWAVSTDSKKVWMCFQPGLVLRMATYEAFEEDMEEIRQILVEAQDIQAAIEMWNYLAESYAHGGTGKREGEDTDNAKYYSEQAKISADNAEAVTGISIMTTEKAGIGKPDGSTITVDEDGTMHAAGGGGASGDFASKAIYGDTAVSLGRNGSSGNRSISYGTNNMASGANSDSFGNNNVSVDNHSFSEGCGNIALGYGSHAENCQNIAGAKYVFKITSYDATAKKITFDNTFDGFSDSFSALEVGSKLHIANVNYINDASIYTVSSIGTDGKSVVVSESIPTSNFSVLYASLIKSGVNYGGCHSEGRQNVSLNTYAHSEGYRTEAKGYCSHTEGNETKATNNQAHSEGYDTVASGKQSHAEGYKTTASGDWSHSEGKETTASSYYSHAEGYKTEASGTCSHAEGGLSKATGYYSYAGGYNSNASGSESFSCGYGTVASGDISFSEGLNTIASGYYSHASGNHTQAKYNQFVIGRYNKLIDGEYDNAYVTGDTLFCVGNGTQSERSNAARIDGNGKLWCKQAYSSTGADYAELFEWADGNPENEDRRGYFVTMEGKKVKKASEGDYILGIVSGNPSVIGNTDMEWYGQFMRDEFGTFIKETHKETITEPSFDEEGNEIEVEKEIEVEFYKVNPDYDPDTPYTFRLDRPEWDAVGMLGVIPVRDDGTCEVGRYCRCADGGIATLAENRGFDTYMVIERISENIVSVILK